MPVTARHRDRDERGATLIIFALLLVAVLIIVAVVIDTSAVRQNRQSDKSAADFAVAAGIHGLEQPGSGIPRPWKGACEALTYLKANNSEFTSLAGTWKTQTSTPTATLFGVTDPCSNPALDPYLLPCVPNSPASWAWFSGTTSDGRIDVDIKSGYVLPDPDFETTTTDPGDPAQGGCDQLAVIVREREQSRFGGVAGVGELASRIRSVGRAEIDNKQDASVALLLLEQHDCLALEVKGGGNEGEVLVFSSPGTGIGGIIAADSAADGSDCSTGNEVIEGKNKSNTPLVRAEPNPSCPGYPACTDNAQMGFITTYAKFLGSTKDANWANAAGVAIPPGAPPGARSKSDVWLCGTTPSCTVGPTGGDRTTRAPADVRYLTPLTTFRDNALVNVFNWIDSNVTPTGYTAYNGAVCNLNSAMTITTTSAYMDCPTLTIKNGGALTIDADNVAFRGDIDINNGGSLRIARPTANVYVNGGTSDGIQVAGTFEVANAAPGASCAAGTSANVARTMVRRGRLEVVASGTMRLCHTFVFLAGGMKTGTWVEGTLPTAQGVAPYANTMNGEVITAAGGSVDWSGPNVTSTTPTSAQINNFEDLAFWSESSGTNSSDQHAIQGGGLMVLRGIFVIPNANPMNVGGSAGSTITADAQFFVRKLRNNGNVSFRMTANPADSIPTPFFKGFTLVR